MVCAFLKFTSRILLVQIQILVDFNPRGYRIPSDSYLTFQFKNNDMRKLTLILAILTIGVLKMNAQKIKESEVPAAVKTSFDKNFSGQTAKWEKEDGNFEAGFKKDGKNMSATFKPDGTFLETEIAIKESEFPTGVMDYIKTNYKGKK